jgi:DNA polymerase III delta prime subunit
MTDSSVDTKKKNEEFKRKIKRDWDNYISTFDEKLDNIWNFVMYNDFMSEEMKKISREIRFLKEDVESKDSKIGRLKEDVDDLIYRNRKLSNKLEKAKPSKTNKKRKREDDKWFNKEKRKKPKTFVAINKDDVNKLLLRVFQNLKSIDDIINLKEDPNRFNYFSNLKYKKLYNLIPSLENLQKVIGMKRVKDDVFKMICYFIHGLNGNGELNHCVITGPPGVGKTTLASILGDIYLGLGFLKNNNFIVAKRSDLIGKYCGHTAVQTQEVIDKADGGVLFIDEVYSLGNPGKRDVFTKECIDTINQNLTEKGDKFLCIIAGYEDDVEKCFFAYNKGLERRFPLRFKIDKYDSSELLLILKKFINEEFWKIEDDKYILKLLKDNKELFIYYGGDMKILFQNAKKIFSLRLMNEKIDLVNNDKVLKNVDFKGALKEFKLNRKTKEIPEFVKNMFM